MRLLRRNSTYADGKYQGRLLKDAGSYNSRDFINFANYAKRRMKAAAEEKGIYLIRFSTGTTNSADAFRAKLPGSMLIFLTPRSAGSQLTLKNLAAHSRDFSRELTASLNSLFQ